MFLKSLALQGFKSFPEYTLIQFHPGVTAIVGPNGSGKSNVTDAIRWVLGEQSVRTLRGGQMEDIIFGGTEQRRAMSFAEVSITLDNTDGSLPLEYAEVEITRRLFRSGESEYMINRQACRLKDIVSLFYDTGLGKDGYSIIGQGQVDHILSNKSEDRRRIFEEAAGIQKYKAKRDEAVRKLEHTEQNLLRLQDIINEVEARLQPLQRQAEQAARWRDLKADLKKSEIALILARLDSNEAELKRLQDLYESQTADKESAEQNRDRQLAERDRLADCLAKSEDERQRLLAQRAERGEALHRASQTLEVCREREEQFKERLSRETDTRAEILSFVKQAESNLAAQDDLVKGLELEAGAAQEQAAAAAAQATEARKSLAELEGRRAQAGAEQAALLAEKDDLLRREIRLEEQKKLQELRRAEQLKDVAQIKQQLSSAQSSIQEGEDRLTRLTAALADGERKTAEKQAAIRQSEGDLEALNNLREQRRHRLNEALYRQETLQDLADRMIGYSEPVKRLMDHLKQKPALAAGVYGTVGNLLVTPADLTLAIEIALGAAIQNIVVADNQTAANLIDILKQKHYGRATFMPVETVKGHSADQTAVAAAQSVQGYLGVAADLVQYETQYTGVMRQLLGRVFVVRDLDTGFAVARKTGRRFRIVSLEGDVLNPGGSVTGGSPKQSGGRGLLGRSSELAELVRQIPDFRAAAEAAEKDQQIAAEELTAMRRSAQAFQTELDAVRRHQLEAKAILDQQKKSYEHLTETGSARQRELDGYELSMADLQAELADLAEQKEQVEGKVKRGEDGRSALEEELESGRQAAERSRLNWQEKEASYKARQEQVEAAGRLAEVYRQELSNRRKELERYTHSFAEIEIERQTNREELERSDRDREKFAAELERLDRQLADLEKERQGQNRARDCSARAAEEAAALLQKLTAELVRSEGRLERLAEAGNADKSRLWTEYELTYLNADEWRQEKPDMLLLDQTVKRLQRALKELGNVNPQALEEYDELKNRYDFMLGQQSDVERSMQDLTSVIRELTGSMREQFSQNIQAINRHFQKTFVELFGGGRGEIVLLNSDDVLTADIEIRACPPGKKLQNMLLLSGGERCLTAIALLFAILALRPTPFCIMDEVEAALDDSNIFRFTDYINRYSNESQFVLVTHRKGTMEAADRIYGVTMPERGISKVLSMQLAGQ